MFVFSGLSLLILYGLLFVPSVSLADIRLLGTILIVPVIFMVFFFARRVSAAREKQDILSYLHEELKAEMEPPPSPQNDES